MKKNPQIAAINECLDENGPLLEKAKGPLQQIQHKW
jgi:hypothetical protein